MTRELSGLENEGDVSCSSSCSSVERFSIGENILQEEERLLKENEKLAYDENYLLNSELFDEGEVEEEEKENFKVDKKLVQQLEAEAKERRYKRLMHLLNNSKMYSLILAERIHQDENRKKSTASSSQNSNENSQTTKKGAAMYRVSDVITKENIAENLKANETKKEEVDEDYFKETRITDLGFTVSHKQPQLLEGGSMRNYQLRGFEWMKNLFANGVNGILADEMGLGKTIQVIAFICYMIEEDIKGPFLIVAPLSTLTNWIQEFKKFAPKVPTMLYHGVEKERKALIPKILEMSKCGNKMIHKVVITSFQIPLKDSAILGKLNWYYLIIDEGHRIKNHNSLLAKTLQKFSTIGRLLLTGTPFQNDLSELWSLLNFLLPEVFNSLDVFQSWFDVRELESNGMRFMLEKFNVDVVSIMQEILVPFLLRREKKDVDLELPPKREVLIYCPMAPRQKELYQATVDRSIELLLKPKEDVLDISEPLPKRKCFVNSPYGNNTSKSKKLPRVESPERKEEERFFTNIVLRNPQMMLRKIVNHPYLIHFPLKPGTEELRIDEELVTQSGKLMVLDALMSKLKSKGHKVIIFSYFKNLLDILEDHAIMRGYKYCRLDGERSMLERDSEIVKFVSDPSIFVFYISIRAGGLGINLTAADTVIFYDSDWNPQVNLQSQDRCHRIGQTKPVVVYRLCAKGTIDEKIIERGNAKRRLEKMILQKGKFALGPKNPKKLNLMDLQELKKLLESTDHDTVIDSNETVFTDEELEALVDRSDMTTEELSQENKNGRKFKVINYEN